MVPRASTILLQRWEGRIGRFDALCECDEHMRQFCMSSADSADSDGGVARPDVACFLYALTIETSYPTSLCNLVCCALFGDDIELMLLPLNFG